ncbi:transmembrane and coiled-coil domain-containing protein 5B-like [Python bivittatus]|uniref:Transmembrane and coiled-coil domain-containing protein 5B-like n=1 Tax=Python bivittatus TaxID=176946 RepID=A0A9F2RA89_PYTBI|nr:transmembrane and coiled-coil domain-containing protein 5B-like [Python bivittatus]
MSQRNARTRIDGSLHPPSTMPKISTLEEKIVKQAVALEDHSGPNESLRLQIDELRETVACLDSENQDLLKENKGLKDQHRSLQEVADQFKIRMEHLQKIVEDVRERIDSANMMVRQVELQNKTLVKAHEELNKEMHEVTIQVAVFKDYKAVQEKDLEEMRTLSSEVKKYLRGLEDQLAETEHGYHVERSHSGELKEKVTTLLKLREKQRKDIKDLQKELETRVQQATFSRLDQENRVQMGSLMHEVVEAQLVGVARNRSKKRKILRWVWMAAKILMMLVFGCYVLLGLVFAYARFVNPEFISETFLAFVSEENIERIAYSFSQYLNWRNDGLLPF